MSFLSKNIDLRGNLKFLVLGLLQCSYVSRITTPGENAIITLDLQLYLKAVQLVLTQEELKDQFILWAGEFHTVIAMCKCIGNFIEKSGLGPFTYTHGLLWLSDIT